MKMTDEYDLSDSDDEMMQDTEEDRGFSAEEERKLALRQQELDEAAQYYEPIDESKEGVYHVKSFDANTEKVRWKADFSKMAQKQYSPTFTIAGNHEFRLLVFPRGNQVPCISLYLDTNNSQEIKLVRFQVSILNQKDIRESHSQDAEKRYGPNDVDWGFKEFIELKKVNPDVGFISTSGIVYFEMVIHICTQPYLIDPISYDSRKETGFAGLQNQGATCYMNSLLQTLYLLTYFRKSVYKMPIDENEKPQDSIPLALMRVFFRLQFDKGAVDTKELTKSFGWDTIDSFLQHDVQEFARVLIDNLEKKMEKTDQKEVMRQIFEGMCKNYIKCINVDYESSRKEPFYDLQLNVKGCKNVAESFDQYILEETLQGENQYQAEGHGLQDAKKGTNFLKLPPVLMLHLKRFEYDYIRDLIYKINDRYEFPLEIDLGKYLSEDSEQKKEDNTYVLFSVLVHSGDVSGGHYYNFARPYINEDRWFKFDDEKVYEVNESLAVQDNYGGEAKKSKMFWLSSNPNSVYKKFTNAYMLLYIRKSAISNMIAPVEVDEIPSHLEERFQKDRDERERKKREKLEAAKYCNIKIVTDDDIKKSVEKTGSGLVEFEDVEPIKFLREGTFAELKEQIETLYGIKAEQQRFWKWQKRQNHTLRPDAIIKPADDASTIERKYPYVKHQQAPPVELYLEVSKQTYSYQKDDEECVVHFPEPAQRYILLFIKEYNPEERKLNFVGTVYADMLSEVSEVIPSIKALIGADEDDDIHIVEEIKPKMIDDVRIDQSFKDAQLQSGDILAVQRVPKGTDLSKYPIPTAKSYYDYLNNRVSVEIRKLEDPLKNVAVVELLKNMEYKELTDKLGSALEVDGNFLRLTGHHPYSEGPLEQPFKSNSGSTLKDMINIGQTPQKILYYEILDEPIFNVENKKELIVTWMNSKCQDVEKFKFLLYPDQKVNDLKQLIEAKVNGRREIENSTIVISQISNFKISKLLTGEELIKTLATNKGETIRAEEILNEELSIITSSHNLTENTRILQVQHICKETTGYRLFGNPSVLVVKTEETLGDVKKRLQDKLQVRDIDYKRYKFYFIVNMKIKDALEDDSLLFCELFDKEKQSTNVDVVLALEHKDPTPKARWYEKPIVIKN
ncbi:predicted protein [Naegleria gruberi]|uniref:ubiquitinyl hydrolase 1 n=1 Tax=Naegleria gruberi TaxID=5762 RepID=D2VYU4_NAEGR|nr:uncharacterized protein NAEGRDRAFT_81745 [Naegleria gruberi]EFC37971.1 predicted protein [Naegleria gruberi]|eukprot:XP_002670715.1 predicted protein [Naegleria gruberi strain NEG-M]